MSFGFVPREIVCNLIHGVFVSVAGFSDFAFSAYSSPIADSVFGEIDYAGLDANGYGGYGAGHAEDAQGEREECVSSK